MDALCEPLMCANEVDVDGQDAGSAAADLQTGGRIDRLARSLGISWWALAVAGIAHAAGVLIAMNWAWSGRLPAADDARVISVVFVPAAVPATPPPDRPFAAALAAPATAQAPPVTQPTAPQPVVQAPPLSPPVPGNRETRLSLPHARQVGPEPSAPVPHSPSSIADVPTDAMAPVAAVLPLNPPRLPSERFETKPVYPLAARRQHIEGRVVLRVDVSPAGTPVVVQVLSSSGHDMLDRAAITAVRSWQFVPAAQGDRHVAGSLDVPIEFRMAD